VSIGSIYLRFESKDRLLHAVIAKELSGIIASECAMIDGLLAKHRELERFLPRYIERYSDLLERNAQLLRAIMQRAAIDPAVSGPGRETARRSATMSVDALLTFSDEIRGGNPRTKAEAVFQIVFATIARQFGLGSTSKAGDNDVWTVVRAELAKMALAYLRFDG
jgi:AcrR family transcriptional regulator